MDTDTHDTNDRSNAHIVLDGDSTNNGKDSENTLFKIPVLTKKVHNKKEKSLVKSLASSKSADEPICDSSPASVQASVESSDLVKNTKSVNENRPLISFQPVSLALPSQVYKPHKPSASEYIEHYQKKVKEKQLQNVFDNKNVSEQYGSTSKLKPADEKTVTKSSLKASKLKYEKPPWSCLCEDDPSMAYSLEVLKSGSIIDKLNLCNKEYFVFGRLSECDITLEHPSISRYHAVLQFGRPTEDDDVEFQKDGSAGFYLYDLNSTHGTSLNKAAVPHHKYYRVKVGHMMKFGGSSRIYILQGPHVDEEDEAKETATELREKARAARSKKDLAKMMMGDDSDDDDDDDDDDDKNKNSSSIRQPDDAGITWGMLEEAVMESDEENEDGNKDVEEPAFLLADKKEPFYVKDPHKALRNFYNKEGMEIDFDCTERRPGQWNVRLELPVDTPSGKAVVAEASLTGKKKDAMNNCALEACRLLDKYGMFKQSEHHRRKIKEWEKEDFYDSDEDQYWDRTGELEKKRKQRKVRIGVKTKAEEDNPQTYESLKQQIDELEKEISQIEKQLEKDKQAVKTKQGSSDPLEEFMQQVKSGKTLDSVTRSKMKLRLFEARKESARLIKLAEIIRPASLPPLTSHSSKSMSFIGRMKGKKKGQLLPSELPQAPVYQPFKIENEEEEEVETRNDEKIESIVNDKVTKSTEVLQSTAPDNQSELSQSVMSSSDPVMSSTAPVTLSSASIADHQNGNDEKTDQRKTVAKLLETVQTEESKQEATDEKASRKRRFGPTLPQELKERLLDGGSTSDESKTKSKKRKKSNTPVDSHNCSNDPNYADWMPPENQTGDGTTSLNAKYGY